VTGRVGVSFTSLCLSYFFFDHNKNPL
jgi:hypothetical protein